jgi:hypothetical protein
MGGNGTYSAREKATLTKDVLASIGRGLREQHDAFRKPHCDRLADLVSNVERPNGPLHVKKPLPHVKKPKARWRSKTFWLGG